MSDVVDLGTLKRIRAANEAVDASKWTPRDVLVDMLSAIDSGEATPETLAVVWIESDGHTATPRYRVAVPDDAIPGFYRTFFLAEVFKQMVMEDGSS